MSKPIKPTLAETHPELAAQADGWDPTEVTEFSHRYLKWKCELAHTWESLVLNRTRGNGCPYCSGRKAISGFNDLATTHPELAAQADGWDPTTIKAYSTTKKQWKCELAHTWSATVGSRVRGDGCPYCSGRRVLWSFNDLATTHPELAAQADGWDPTTITAGSHRRVRWKCSLRHKWETPVYNRTGGKNEGTNCPYCSNRKVLAGFNDLATTHPELAAQADGWDPTTITAGSNLKFKWKCDLAHKWRSTAYHRSLEGTGCPSCAIWGFNPGLQGYLYLIEHFDWGMQQIGITNNPDQRLAKHMRSGWNIIELRGPSDGHLTRSLESSSLQALEKRGAIRIHKTNFEQFDGYTEAWTKASLNVTSIKQILDWVYKDESTNHD
jgi:hypothetical protein